MVPGAAARGLVAPIIDRKISQVSSGPATTIATLKPPTTNRPKRKSSAFQIIMPVGGTINLRTIRPLDLKDPLIAARAQMDVMRNQEGYSQLRAPRDGAW